MTIDRTAYIASLRLWADLLEDRPDLPLPWQADELVFYSHDLAQAIALHALMARPVFSRDNSAFPVRFTGRVLGMRVDVAVHGKVALADDTSPVLPPLVPALAALADPTAPLVHLVSK